MNDELKRMWIKVILVYLKILSRHSPGGIEENMKNLSQDSWFPAEVQTGRLPECIPEALLAGPRVAYIASVFCADVELRKFWNVYGK
jgi:hypothetical protein